MVKGTQKIVKLTKSYVVESIYLKHNKKMNNF